MFPAGFYPQRPFFLLQPQVITREFLWPGAALHGHLKQTVCAIFRPSSACTTCAGSHVAQQVSAAWLIPQGVEWEITSAGWDPNSSSAPAVYSFTELSLLFEIP